MTDIGLYLLGLLMLVLGADSLMRSVAGFARKAGLPATSTGLLLLGLVAAAPQLSVTACALATGQQALAFGNAVGGNLASLGLALGVAALVNPLRPKMHLLGLQAIAVVVAAFVLLLFGLGGVVGRIEGALLVIGFIGMLVAQLRAARLESDPVKAELTDFAETSTNTTQNLIRLAIGGALLFFGSRLVVQGAPGTGALLGLDPLASGLTLLALGSALPSVLLAVLAATNEQGSVAIAQALGACLCNLLLSVGAIAIAAPLVGNGAVVRIGLLATMALAALLYLLVRQGNPLGRREGALLACAFIAWLGVVVGGAIS
jgi:cation:H+ antiporter